MQYRTRGLLPRLASNTAVRCVRQGVMDDWPAMAKWSAAYFKQLLGDKDVTVGERA